VRQLHSQWWRGRAIKRSRKTFDCTGMSRREQYRHSTKSRQKMYEEIKSKWKRIHCMYIGNYIKWKCFHCVYIPR
jgi:hypothetical protein